MIEEAKLIDRSGSVILEHLLLAPDLPLSLKPNITVKQALMVGSWYLWCIRRELNHDGRPPHPTRWHMSVLTIASNYHEANHK